MEVTIVDKKLKETTDKIELKESVWNTGMNTDLVMQVVKVYRSNKRSSNASSKDRRQVSGGGRKLWKQKGTGRARHGSTRSPIWVGGGVTFGPTGRNWKRTVNKKMRLGALSSVLSERLRDNEVYFMAATDIDRGNIADVKTVVITDNGELYKNLRNVSGVKVLPSAELNALDALHGKRMFVDSACLPNLEKRFG